MSMNYREVPRGIPEGELRKYDIGIDLVDNFVDSLEKKGLLPKRFAKAVEPSTVPARAESQLSLPSLDKLVVAAEAPEIAKTWAEKGITNFDFYRLSAHEFKRDGDYPGWNVKPEPWFWENVANGRISEDATKLEEMLIAIDNTPKPNYDNGRQLYQSDPFAPLLERLRKEKKINVPRDLRHIPNTSRFGISPNELTEHVLPAIAEMLGVDSNHVRLPKEIEFNITGNLFHPEWGNTNTLEWFADKFGDGSHLFGGDSGRGGLADVDRRWSDFRSDLVAFGPVVRFPSKPR